jgi:8-oxo-dGTP diphosphatase
MPILVPKAFIYLTRGTRELLLLAHPEHPEAGLQVPAGTIEAGESPEQAAIRELTEETGLDAFHIHAFLGEATYDMRPFGKPELHQRFFHHAVFEGIGPDRWLHMELHAGPIPIPFELFWWNLDAGAPQLIAGHGAMLARLFNEALRKS